LGFSALPQPAASLLTLRFQPFQKSSNFFRATYTKLAPTNLFRRTHRATARRSPEDHQRSLSQRARLRHSSHTPESVPVAFCSPSWSVPHSRTCPCATHRASCCRRRVSWVYARTCEFWRAHAACTHVESELVGAGAWTVLASRRGRADPVGAGRGAMGPRTLPRACACGVSKGGPLSHFLRNDLTTYSLYGTVVFLKARPQPTMERW